MVLYLDIASLYALGIRTEFFFGICVTMGKLAV